jgi:hypothetical protein
MRDDENDRRQKEKGDERQWHITQKRKFDWAFEQKIFVGNGARRDADIKQDKK